MHDEGDEPGRRAAMHKSCTPLPPGVPRVRLPSGKLAAPVATMMLLRTRDWMQELLDHHVPPLTREDVVVFALIDFVGVIDPVGSDITFGLPYPSILDTAQAVYIVARRLLIEIGWIRDGDSRAERLTAILQHAQPCLDDLQQVLAQPETVRSGARAERLRVLHRHRRAGAAARNQALTDAFATMRRRCETEQRAIALAAYRRGYLPTADPLHVRAEVQLAMPSGFQREDGNGWPKLDWRGLLRRLRRQAVPHEQERTRAARQLKLRDPSDRAAILTRFEDAPTAHRNDDPAGAVEDAHDGNVSLRRLARTPAERALAWIFAIGAAKTKAEAGRDLGITPEAARARARVMRRRAST